MPEEEEPSVIQIGNISMNNRPDGGADVTFLLLNAFQTSIIVPEAVVTEFLKQRIAMKKGQQDIMRIVGSNKLHA